MIRSILDPRSFAIPIVTAVIIQGAVITLLATHWMNAQPPNIVVPKHISATMVHMKKPQKAAQKVVKKPVRTKKVKPIAKPVVKKTIAKKTVPKKTVAKKAVPAKQSTPKKVETPAKKAAPVAPDLDFSDALALEAEQMELDRAQQEEADAQKRDKEAVAVASYIGQIRSLIESVWSIPPSAKHTDTLKIRIFLVPTGEVADVQLVDSSGNSALDRSAEQAVWRVSKLPVPEDPLIFERNFRKFAINLTPENARL